MTSKEIIAQLLKNGAKSVKGLVVKNVTITQLESYTRLGLTLDKEVDGYRQNDNGEFEPAKVNVIFVSAFTIKSILQDNAEAAFAANHLINHPEALSVVLSRAEIDIVQESIAAGTEYKNPFASSDTSTVFDHDTIINHISSIKLSDFGLRKLERLSDLMMGFAA